MSTPVGWKAEAHNQASGSENRIPADDVARQFGFRGGPVPGVTVYAYLVHPALLAWGRAWLERGSATLRLQRPLYDRGHFEVAVDARAEHEYDGRVIDEHGVVCAEGRVALARAPADPPARRGDPPASAAAERPAATRGELEKLREKGLGALSIEWREDGELDRYLRDPDEMPALVRPGAGGLANPAWTLGLANWVLGRNVRLGPWIHAASQVHNHAAVEPGTGLVVEARITDLFERRGHEFVDLDVGVFTDSGAPVLGASHRAIYQLRPPDPSA